MKISIYSSIILPSLPFWHPSKSILYWAVPDDAKYVATSTNQAQSKPCQTNGTMGKNNVDIMCPTAMDPSSINSMAIFIRFRKNIKMMSMMSRMIADKMRKMSQVTVQNKEIYINVHNI